MGFGGFADFVPVIDGLDVFVFGRVPVRWHVALAELFALIDVDGAGEGGLHEAQELGAELAVFIFVAAVARDGARVIC